MQLIEHSIMMPMRILGYFLEVTLTGKFWRNLDSPTGVTLHCANLILRKEFSTLPRESKKMTRQSTLCSVALNLSQILATMIWQSRIAIRPCRLTLKIGTVTVSRVTLFWVKDSSIKCCRFLPITNRGLATATLTAGFSWLRKSSFNFKSMRRSNSYPSGTRTGSCLKSLFKI